MATPFPELDLVTGAAAPPPAAADTLVAANRAARVARYGEAAVAAMEKAGTLFGGAARTPTPGIVPPTGFGAAFPTFAKWGTALGGAATPIAATVEGARVVDSALDPSQSAGETALRTGMGAGRVAGMVAGAKVPGPWYAKAAGATLGYSLPGIAETVSRWLGRGAAPTTPAPAAAPATDLSSTGTFTGGMAAADRVDTTGFGAVAPTVAPPPAPVAIGSTSTGRTITLPGGSAPDARDWEASRMNARGVATYGQGNGFGAGQRGQEFGNVGDYVRTTMAVKRDAAVAGQANLDRKWGLEFGAKAATGAKDLAGAELIRNNGLAADRAAAAGASAEVVSAIRNGHTGPAPSFGAVATAMPDAKTGAIPMEDRRTGRITMETPVRRATEANITASMTGQKLSRAQAIAAYKARGFDVTGLQ